MNIYVRNNPYGFRLNVTHPMINEYFKRYQKWKGLPQHFPITDEQRREFERYMFERVLNK